MNRRVFFRLSGIHYAWIVFAVAFITLLAASGIRSTPGVLMVPLEGEFGWSRATISLAVSINLLLFGFVGPFAAAMMDRWGIRPVVAGALLLHCCRRCPDDPDDCALAALSAVGIVVGLGAGTMATVFAATVANRWFVRRRGLVVGLLTAASATGQLIFLPFLGWLAQERGWRYVSLTVAHLHAGRRAPGPGLPADRPEDVGIRAYGASEDDPPAPVRGNPVAMAFRGLAMASGNRNFWLLAATFFICGASTNGLIGTHLIPASVDHGMAEVTAASLLAVIGIFDVAGTTISGG